MDNFFQIASLKYDIENPVLKKEALYFGIFSTASYILTLCMNWLSHGVTGYFFDGHYFHFNMLNKKDWALLTRVWRWLYLEPNQDINTEFNQEVARLIARFS